MKQLLLCLVCFCGKLAAAQMVSDTLPLPDTSLRIVNLNSYFTQNVDSIFVYQFTINKDQKNYYWYLRNAPVGLTIGKDNGLVSFHAAKNYFLSGRLKYDYPYTVQLGVQNLQNPKEKTDTFFSILFYNTEILASKLKPSVSGTITIEEGDTVVFRLQCETGSFPFETILFNSNLPIRDYHAPLSCGDSFTWTPPFDFVKETDSAKSRVVLLSFVGATKYNSKDTAVVRIIVKDALNYSLAVQNYLQVSRNVRDYTLQLKFAFLQLDKKLKKVKNTRTAFDLTAASTAMSGTVLNTSSGSGAQRAGKILPSVGLALTPIKEATAPAKNVEQNQAAMIRSSIKRLDYILDDNQLLGEKDPNIITKTQKLKDELKQAQVQMIDIPVDMITTMSEEQLNNYFNSPKVNKKYRLKKSK